MTSTTLLSAFGALGLIIAVILSGSRLLRGSRLLPRPARTENRLALIDTISLDPRRRLVLVRCDERCVLLMTGQQDLVVGWLQVAAP